MSEVSPPARVTPASLDQFGKYVGQLSGFEKLTYRLVASSLLFSALSSVVTALSFKNDPGFAALTLLAGTIGGITAVLTTFASWAHHPMDERSFALQFRPAPFKWKLAWSFVGSILSLYLYYYLAHLESLLSALIMPVATFCLFRGLCVGMLMAKTIDAQRAVWDGLSAETKDEIIAAERQARESREKYIEEVKRQHEEHLAFMAEINKVLEEARRRRHVSVVRRVRNGWERMLRSTESFRYRVGGRRLLTPSEKANREVIEILTSDFSSGFEKIKRGELPKVALEFKDAEMYKNEHGHYYLVLSEDTDEDDARLLLQALADFRHPKTKKFKQMSAIVTGLGLIGTPVRDLLSSEGIIMARSIDWKIL